MYYQMGTLIGAQIGGFVMTYLFGRLFGRLWKNARPDERARNGAALAFVTIAIIASFGFENVWAGLLYTPGAILGFLYLRRDYRKQWIENDSTFD